MPIYTTVCGVSYYALFYKVLCVCTYCHGTLTSMYTAIKVTFSHLGSKETTEIAICISHILGSLHQDNIRMSGSKL